MKNYLLLIFLFSGTIFAQNPDPSSIFLPLAQVDKAPGFSGCDPVNNENCSLEKITTYFLSNIEPEILKSVTPEDSYVVLKFIIDEEGKVRNSRVQSEHEVLKLRSLEILESLPDFTPALSQGKPVNVIMNIPIKLKLNDDESLLNKNPFDTRAIYAGCENEPDPEYCSQTKLVIDYSKSFYDLNIKTKGETIISMVALKIDEDGNVTEVTAEGTNKRLNNSVLRWGKQIKKFIPAVKDGKNVSMTYTFPLTYSSSN